MSKVTEQQGRKKSLKNLHNSEIIQTQMHNGHDYWHYGYEFKLASQKRKKDSPAFNSNQSLHDLSNDLWGRLSLDSFSQRQGEYQKCCYQKNRAIPQATSQSQKDLQTHVSTLCNIIKKFYSHKTINMPPGCTTKEELNESLQGLVWTAENTPWRSWRNNPKHRSIDKRTVFGLFLASNESWPKFHCKPLEKCNEPLPKEKKTPLNWSTWKPQWKRKYQRLQGWRKSLFLCNEVLVQIIMSGIHFICDF